MIKDKPSRKRKKNIFSNMKSKDEYSVKKTKIILRVKVWLSIKMRLKRILTIVAGLLFSHES